MVLGTDDIFSTWLGQPESSKASMACAKLCGWLGKCLIGLQTNCHKPFTGSMKIGVVRMAMENFDGWRGFQCTLIATKLGAGEGCCLWFRDHPRTPVQE